LLAVCPVGEPVGVTISSEQAGEKVEDLVVGLGGVCCNMARLAFNDEAGEI
jgi:hypothetical protein